MKARAVAAWTVMGLCVAFLVGGLTVAAVYQGGPFEWGGVGFGLAMLVAPAIGALIVSRAPNVVGWLLLVVGIGGTVAIALGSVADASVAIPGQLWAAWLGNWIWVFALASLILILQVFPDGQLVSPRWRWVIALTAVAVASLTIGGALAPGPLGDYQRFTNPIGVEALRGTLLSQQENIGWLLLIPSILGSAASLVTRYRRSSGERRQQLKWLAYAASLFGLGWIAVTTTWESRTLALVGEVLFGLGILSLPVAIGIAVLKYRVYDIDVVINKTLVYALLAGFITAIYVGVVVGIGAVLGSRGEPNLALQVAATALVAVAFQPVRARVQRLANRLVYGQRGSPYETLARFSDRVAATYAAEDVLPRLARIVAEGTGAREASVWLRLGTQLRRAAQWPAGDVDGQAVPLDPDGVPVVPGADRTLPVRHRDDVLGALAIAKAPGDPLRSEEESLLSDLASQAGLVLRNVRLTEELRARLEEVTRLAEELRASRRRLVATQDASRRKLERDIHDGAQQHLVALAVQLKLAQNVAAKDPAKVRPVLERLVAVTQDALADLRDLTRGVYPPLLEREGLVPSLRAAAARSPVPVAVEANGLTRRPPDVEAAVYFSVLEALQNAAKYADATRVEVRLGEDRGDLTFEVRDDGRGFDPSSAPAGSGLTNIADRLRALGGSLKVRSAPGEGTTVTGRVPVRAAEAVR
ncbi:MAG TPA: histidine kinase [Actinomycetota bacterium]|nr:histidine kinase [Actinomycetota bacterium]